MLSGSDESQEKVPPKELPENLKQFIDQLDPNQTKDINLDLDNLDEGNIELFVQKLTARYGKKEHKQKMRNLFELKFVGSNQQLIDKANLHYGPSVTKVLTNEMFVYPNETREPKKSKEILRIVLHHFDDLYKHSQTLEESRKNLLDKAFTEAIHSQFERCGRNLPGAKPGFGGMPDGLRSKMGKLKKDYILEKAKKDLGEKGLGKSVEERRDIQVSLTGQTLMSMCVGYSFKAGLMNPRSIGPVVEKETKEAFDEWLWSELQEEALKEFEEDYGIKSSEYDLDNPSKRRKYFEAVYTKYYESELQKQSIGEIRAFPPSYSASIYAKDMIQAQLDFMAKGAFRNKLSTAKFELKSPRDTLDRFEHSFDDYVTPLAKHVEKGRPIPFQKMAIKHAYPPQTTEECDGIFANILKIATGVADHPADYFKLASIEFDFVGDDIANLQGKLDATKYLNFIRELSKLVDREENPLRTEVDLDRVNKFYYKALQTLKDQYELPDKIDEVDEHVKDGYQKLVTLTKEIDHFRFRVAENRRILNYKILIEGESGLGDMTEIEVDSPEEVEIVNDKDIRACKRITSLDEALRGASMEQEMEEEEEEEQEKEAEKEKEQEAEQDQDQDQEAVHGNVDENLKNLDEFRNFVKEICYYQVEEKHIAQMWHNLTGETQTQSNKWVVGENIRVISKEAVEIMLQDPDVFRSGLVDGNLPKGFHFGLLAIEGGSDRGIYYDITEPDLTEENPLTIRMSDPVESLPRLKASGSHFNIKAKMTKKERFAAKLVTAPIPGASQVLEEPTQEEIDYYNRGELDLLNSNYGSPMDGWAVVGKMAFCTRQKPKSLNEYRKWGQDPITRAISKVVQPQKVAEYAVSLGGDAVFELNDRLNAIKKRAGKLHQQDLFENFLNDFVLQKDIDSWLKPPNAPNFCEHMFRHEQFKGMEDLMELSDNDFKFFMTLVNKHGKHHCRTDLSRLLQNFKYFREQFNDIYPGQELPVENLDKMIENCSDMRVAMDRMLVILKNAQKHGMETEQLTVLKDLDLRYQTAYHAVEHNRYKIVLPEMGVDWEAQKANPLNKKSTISNMQSTALFHQFTGVFPVEECKKLFYQQFALVDDTPNIDKFKSLAKNIAEIATPEYDNPERVQAFLYSFAGFTLYHPKERINLDEYLNDQVDTLANIKEFLENKDNVLLKKRLLKIKDGNILKSVLSELNNELQQNTDLKCEALISKVNELDAYDQESLKILAQAVDKLAITNVQEYAKFLQGIHLSQMSYVSGEHKRGAPTPETLSTYIKTIDRLHKNNHFQNIDPSKDKIHKCVNFNQFFEHSGQLLNAIHQIGLREDDQKLSDAQLAYVLHTLESATKQQSDEPDPIKDKLAELEGGLLTTLALIQQPDEDFIADDSNENSLASLLKEIQQQACDEDDLKFEALKDALTVLNTVNWQAVEPRPTFGQMKNMLVKAMTTPQPNYESVKNWILSEDNPGLNGLEFDLSQLEEKAALSLSLDGVYQKNKSQILSGLNKSFDDINFEQGQEADFEEFIGFLMSEKVEESVEQFDASNAMGYFKQTLYTGLDSGINVLKEEKLQGNFTKKERANILGIYDKNYPKPTFNPVDLKQLKEDIASVKQLHEDTEDFFLGLEGCKEILGHKFNLILSILTENQTTQIPMKQLTAMLGIVASDYRDNKIFNHQILSTILQYEKLDCIDGNWGLVNNAIQSQVLENTKVEKSAITRLILNMAVNSQLESIQVAKLLELSDKNMPVYNQLVASINGSFDKGSVINVRAIIANTISIVEQGCDEKDIIKLLDKAPDLSLLNNIKSINDPEKQNAIIKIINRSLDTTIDAELSDAVELINILKQLPKEDLKELSSLDIDAEFPKIDNLTVNARRLVAEQQFTVENYIDKLQEEFFEKKNDPKLINRIFNDGRVVDVIDSCETLQFSQDLKLPTELKEKLLSDYAYIHAIGLNKPVYNGKSMRNLTKKEIKTLRDELKDILQGDSTEKEKHVAMLKMLALSREVYFRATLPDGRFPYSTQMMSVLMAFENGNLNINEIATGQGKSLTAALYATVMWAQDKPAIVCTSNMTLAKEGMEENAEYYEYMGIPTTLVRAQSKADEFEHNGVNYTDVSNMALFIAKNEIQGKFTVENPGLILDEADFTVLDEVTDFRYAVNLSSDNLSSEVNMDEWLYYQINDFVDRPEFINVKVSRQADVSNCIAYLRKRFEEDVQSGKLEEPFKSHIEDKLLDFQLEGGVQQRKLDTWIDSTWNARMIYQEGRDEAWTMEKYLHKDGNYYNAARIISHHRVSKGSKWSKGVHQFLHARINTNAPEDQLPCRVDSEKSHVAAYSSKNFVDFFIKRNGAVWGMTGTIGSVEECAELREKYGFKLARMETHQKRTATDLDEIYTKNSTGHINAVYGAYKKHSLNKRKMPTVIVEENAKYAQKFKDKFFAKIKSDANKYNPPPTLQFYNGICLEIYDYKDGDYVKRDIAAEVGHEFSSTEEKEDYIKQVAGRGNTVTVTTPMMGRGTDFKPKMANPDQKGKFQDHPDGLFVIQNYAESSVREQRQIKGRMGRQGKKGLYVNIVDKSRFIDKLKSVVPNVPRSLRNFNPQRMSDEVGRYKATSNLNLAKDRQLKQTFGDIRGHFYQKFIGMMAMGDEDRRFNELKHILRETENFNEVQFRKEFNSYMLEAWNGFLVDLDKKFIMLKDKHNNNYEKIFEELKEFGLDEWNGRMIEGLKKSYFTTPELRLEADAILAEFQEFKPEQLEQYAVLMHHRELLIDEREEMESEALLRKTAITAITKDPELTKDLITYIPEDEKPKELEDEALIEELLQNPNLLDGALREKLEHKSKKDVSKNICKKRKLEAQIQENIENNNTDDNEKLQQEADEIIIEYPESSIYRNIFDEQLYQSKVDVIIEKGRKIELLDPDLSIQRKSLGRTIINYPKHYWLKDPDTLKSSDNPKNEIAHILAIDTFNQVVLLNKKIESDKVIGVDIKSPFEILDIQNPYPNNEYNANHYIARYLAENPQSALDKLQAYYMNQCTVAKSTSLQTHLQDNTYTQLLNNYNHTCNELLVKISESELEVLTFTSALTRHENSANEYAENQTLKQLIKMDPEKAITYQQNKPHIKPESYDVKQVSEQLKEEINIYLKRKWVNRSRKKNAKNLLKALDGCQDINQILAAILEAREKAIHHDVSAFTTQNKSGSRYQDMLNKNVHRIAAGASNEGDLILLTDHMRKEMAAQMYYLKSKFRLVKTEYEPIYQESLALLGMVDQKNPQPISLKEIGQFIEGYTKYIDSVMDSKNDRNKSSPDKSLLAAIKVLNENLTVFKELQRKLELAGVDLNSENKIITDIAWEAKHASLEDEHKLESRKVATLQQTAEYWPNLSADEWNEKLSTCEPKVTIQEILGEDHKAIKLADMHKIISHTDDPVLWNLYLQQIHYNTIQQFETNNPRFDRNKFPAAKTLTDIFGEEKVPRTPTEFFQFIVSMNEYKNQIASVNGQSERCQLFSLPDAPSLPVHLLGEQAKAFMDKAIDNIKVNLGPPLTKTKIENVYREFDSIDKDIKNSTAWISYWHDNRDTIIQNAKKSLIRRKQNEFVREYRNDHPEAKNLPKKLILDKFDQGHYPEIINFDGEAELKKKQEEVLSAYRFKVISNTQYYEENEENHQLNTTRSKDFLQRINAKRREGLSKDEAFNSLKNDFEQHLKQESDECVALFKQMVEQGSDLNNVIVKMDNNIEKTKAICFNAYLGLNAEDNEYINPLVAQRRKFAAFNDLMTTEIENIAGSFVPSVSDEHVSDETMNLIQTTVSDLLQTIQDTDQDEKLLIDQAIEKILDEKQDIDGRFQVIIDLKNYVASLKDNEAYTNQFNDLTDILKNLEERQKQFVDNNVRVLDLIKSSVDTIINSQQYRDIKPLGRAALKARLTSKESIDKVYEIALEKRTNYFKNKIKQHFKSDDISNTDWLFNDKEGVFWVTYPRSRRELIVNLHKEITNDLSLFNPSGNSKKTARNARTELKSKLIEAYKQSIEDDLKNMPKQHAKALLESLKKDPLLQPTGWKAITSPNARKNLIAEWNKLVDERPDTPVYEVPGIMTKDSHTGLDVNLGLWKELEQVITETEEQEVAIEMLKTERQFYELPKEEEYTLTVEQMKAMLDDKKSHEQIKSAILAISNLEDRIQAIEQLFNSAIDEANFENKSKMGFFKDKTSENQKQIVGILQELFVDSIESLAYKKAHEDSTQDSMKWSKELPEELHHEVVEEILVDIKRAKENTVLNAGVSEIKQRQLVNKLDKISSDVAQKEKAVIDPELESRERQRSRSGSVKN